MEPRPFAWNTPRPWREDCELACSGAGHGQRPISHKARLVRPTSRVALFPRTVLHPEGLGTGVGCVGNYSRARAQAARRFSGKSSGTTPRERPTRRGRHSVDDGNAARVKVFPARARSFPRGGKSKLAKLARFARSKRQLASILAAAICLGAICVLGSRRRRL